MKSATPISTQIPALIEELTERYGDRLAIVGGEQRLTYRQLQVKVQEAASGLYALGIRPKDHVAILMGNKPEWIISFLAVQCLGATAVCLNTWSTPRELEYTIAHAEIKCLIAVSQFRKYNYQEMLSNMQPHRERLPHLQKIVWLPELGHQLQLNVNEWDWQTLIEGGSVKADAEIAKASAQVNAKDIAVLLYTSGSTAAPKGILLEQGNWILNSWHIGERQGVTPQDRLWLAVSLFWSFGSVNAFPNIFTHGACVVLQEHFDAELALQLIEKEKCTVVYGTPNMFQALSEHPDRARRNLKSLRTGAMIGTPEQIQVAVDLGLNDICNVYGLSETYGNCAVMDFREPLSFRMHSVGQPLPGVDLRICDMETGRVLPVGEVGEIRVKGVLFQAYYKDPDKTNESYDVEGYFCSGDLGELDPRGFLFYKGRLKEMVKSGGINIAPIEVEEVLMRHLDVKAAYVIGMPDPQLDEILVALLIPKSDAQKNIDSIRLFCKQELAAYKVPAKFQWVKEQDLPLTSTGKLQKMKLHELVISS